MATTPLPPGNLGGRELRAITDLGLAATIGNSATLNSTVIQQAAGCDVFVIIKCASAHALTLNFKQAATAAAAAAMSSPVATALGADTNEHVLHFAVDPTTPFWAIQLVDGGAGGNTFTELAVEVVLKRLDGTDPVSVATFESAVASAASPNAGDGRLTLAPV